MDTPKPLDTSTELRDDLRAQGVRYVLGSWVDVLGRAKSKLVPIGHLPHLMAGSERYTPRGMGDLGHMNPTEQECIAMPDPSTLTVLPWDSRVAFMAADMVLEDGVEPWENCPRSILKAQLAKAGELGLKFNLGVETEFYVFRQDSLPDLVPLAMIEQVQPTPCYEVETALDSLDFLDRLAGYMEQTGFDLFSFDQEGGDGQFEYDFAYDEALAMCDKLTLFRLMLRQTAKEFDAFVTFMPKPMRRVWGSGAHMNMSLEEIETGRNIFRIREDGKPDEWTKEAKGFIAGVLRHAPALMALTCPTVNSYKRLVGRLVDGSISWAPIWASWGQNNRSCMMRIPDNRPALENRAVDSAANMYLASAFTLAAGLEGIALGLDPGDPAEEATYEWDPRGHDHNGAKRLPRTLLEAIEAFEADGLTKEVFAPGFIADYVDMKHREWEDYNAEVTPWELERYMVQL